MSRQHKDRDEVYAILRWDGFRDREFEPDLVMVKEIVRSEDIAKAEIARLNALSADKNVLYWYQTTRLFPEGTSAGPGAA